MAILSISRRYIWFLHNTPPLQVVRGTLYALASPVQNMGINHRGFHVLMAEELLDCPNVVAPFQKIRRKGMAKGVAGGAFGESGFSDRASDRFLDDGFMGMMPPLTACFRILPSVFL